MDQEQEKPNPPVIPPPNLSAPPPSPPSPMDAKIGAGPPKMPQASAGEGGVKVTIRDGSGEDDALVQGIAPFNTRATAAVIDWLVAFGIMLALLMILPSFASKLGWLAAIGYLITRDSLPFLSGQSVGKKAMKLKVVTLDDKPLTGNWEAGVIRNAVLAIPFFAFIELFILLTREDKPERGRRLGDEWAKTKVIIAPEPPAEEKSE